MSQVTATRFLRTTIVMADCAVDVQLPADVAVEDVIYETVRFLNDTLNQQGYDTEWLRAADAVWTLEKSGRRQLDSEKTLAEQGINDGDRLWLSRDAKNETYPALIDDIAESVAQGQEQFPKWEYSVDGTKFAAFMLGAVGVVGSLLATFLVCWGLPTDSIARYPVIAAVAAVAVLVTALAVPLIRGGSVLLGGNLLAIGYAAVTAVGLMVIPRTPGLWHIATTGVAVTIYALVMMFLAKEPTRMHAMMFSISGTITLISVINYLYAVSPAVIAIETATIAYLLILMASKIAMAAGRIETPYVPAAGEALTNGEASLGDVNRSATSAEVIESVVNQKKQSYAAHQYLMGLLYGSLTTISLSVLFAGVFATDRPITVFFATLNERWLLCMYAVAVSAALLNRGRNHVDRDVHYTLLSSSLIIPASYLVGLCISDVRDNLPQIIATVSIVLLAVLIGGLWALGQRMIKSPTVRRYFELVEYAIYATPILWLGWLLDVYMKVRNR